MKKNLKSIFAAFAAFTVVLSCSKVEGPVDNTDNGAQGEITEPSGQTTISATLTDALTKVAFTPSYGTDGKPESLVLTWEAGDKLRVYNHADKTQYEDFELVASSAGQKTGQFTGTLPVSESYDVEIINGDVDYAVQVQPADGVTSSLKYLASASAVADVKTLTFTDYSSVLAITAKLPEGVAAVVGSVDITASESIFSTGKTLTISLSAKGDAGNDGILHLFANLPQGEVQIPEGTTLLVHFNAPDTDHTVYTRYVELGAQTFAAGKLNTINVNASQSDKHAGLATCDGTTSEKAYLIGDKYQMLAMAGLLNADEKRYFELVDDVDLNGAAWTSLDAKIDFNGNNHTVSNLSGTGGLFATLDGSVTKLVLDAAVITPEADNAGVLANIASDGTSVTFVDVTNSQITSAKSNTGGLIGQFYGGTIEDVDVACAVTGVTATGGLVGLMNKGELTRCTASGNVSATIFYTGGLVGQMIDGSVTSCSASGKVVNTRYNHSHAGGLIGYVSAGTVASSYAAGNTEATGQKCGGLIGTLSGGTIEKCYATGSVTASTNLSGGLIGIMESGKVDGCYATGILTTAGAYAGGLIGELDSGVVENCYFNGNVNASNESYCHVGGLIGTVHAGEVKKCYSTGEMNLKGNTCGGFIGTIAATETNAIISISQCYATGSLPMPVAGKIYRGGFIGEISKGIVTISNSFATGKVEARRHSGGFIGHVHNAAKVDVTNSFVNSALVFAVPAQAGVFVGNAENNESQITYTGFIGWNTSGLANFIASPDVIDVKATNYFGTEGTISVQARKLNWSTDIWDLTKDVPTLIY